MKRMTIDSAHSEIGFKVKHLMISTVKGNFTTYGGGLQEDGSLVFPYLVLSVASKELVRDPAMAGTILLMLTHQSVEKKKQRRFQKFSH